VVSRSFNFDSPSGYRLAGRLEQPDMAPRAWAIFAHCFTCGKDNRAAVRVAQALARTGVGVLRFDFAGLGTSGGNFAEAGFAADVRDLTAAGAAMTNAGMPPALLIGHSLGGAAVLCAAGEMPAVRAVATLGAPADVAHVLHQFDAGSLARIKQKGEAEILLADRPFVVRQSFLDDLQRHDLLHCVAGLRRPLLVLHGPLDTTVGIDNATRIFTAAKHPKSFVSLDDADHLLMRHTDADFAASVIASWAARYLPQAVENSTEIDDIAGAVAEETGIGRYQAAIQTGTARFLADEPLSAGGLGSGPGPYELVSAGLAACTTMTLRMYAERKNLPVERIRTTVTHTKIPDATPADQFSRSISLEGPLDAAQRASLLSIAERCPVHRTLERGSSVATVLEDDAG